MSDSFPKTDAQRLAEFDARWQGDCGLEPDYSDWKPEDW